MIYRHIFEKRYVQAVNDGSRPEWTLPNRSGYYWHATPLPDWLAIEIIDDAAQDSRRVRVHSRIHVNKCTDWSNSWSMEFSHTEILTDISENVRRRWID